MAKEVAGYITGYTVIVNKSIVPVGTSDEVEAIIRKANTNADFDVVSNPEFLREGAAMSDFKYPDRIVIGAETERAGANVKAYDPEAMDEAKHMLPDITYCSGVYDCAKNADALAIITEWDKFRVLDFGRLSEIMKSKTLIDFRNIYEPGSIRQLGYNYISVGRN